VHHECTENSVQVHDYCQAFDFLWAIPGGLESGTIPRGQSRIVLVGHEDAPRALLNPSHPRGTDSPTPLCIAARCNIFSVESVESVFHRRQVWSSLGGKGLARASPPEWQTKSGVMAHLPQAKDTTSGPHDLRRQSSEL
jgi:hypothetical protein